MMTNGGLLYNRKLAFIAVLLSIHRTFLLDLPLMLLLSANASDMNVLVFVGVLHIKWIFLFLLNNDSFFCGNGHFSVLATHSLKKRSWIMGHYSWCDFWVRLLLHISAVITTRVQGVFCFIKFKWGYQSWFIWYSKSIDCTSVHALSWMMSVGWPLIPST